MNRRSLLAFTTATAVLMFSQGVFAQESLKIGLILPMTGPFASTGKQISAAANLYLAQKGAMVAGKKIEIILKDDGGVADVTKRLAQELIVNENVLAIAGFGLTPLALATAPLATQAKVPMVVMSAATSIITERSPYIVRTSQVVPQISTTFAEWVAKNGIKRVTTLVSDFGPGHDIEKTFSDTFKAAGGSVENLRVPLANPDFSPFLQKVADGKPEALLVFVPAGVGSLFMKQFAERGLDKSGIRLIGTGDITDDDILNNIGDIALGMTTAHHYSASHDSPENKAFVDTFKKANNGLRPNFMAVGGYDGMHALVEGFRKSGGKGGDALLDAMKGLSWVSPRGPISIDAETRDIVQNVYIRKVEKVNGELYNMEFETIPNVKDPLKVKK